MRKRILYCLLVSCNVSWMPVAFAQQVMEPGLFHPRDVSLLDGPFRHARDLNIQHLLQYDVDRLLAPYQKEAGLTPKAAGYPNWEGLDGHVGGHYLSALAMNFASTNDRVCKQRMDHMISVLSECQDEHTKHHAGWGKGYVGGVPNSARIWSSLKAGDFTAYHSAWVPWYNVHKMYAGLRDAWMYGGSEDAKRIFLQFCDWAIEVTASLTEEQMQSMLATEHGGMNEVLADAYQITRDEKYLVAAKRFSHKAFLDSWSSSIDNLDNKHANTQVPKAIGFHRIGVLSGDQQYRNAGRFFWETVTTNRSLAFGGNSRREFFPAAPACGDFVNEVEGPETCNSYNMLKLTENLFRQNPTAEYANYYERTLFTHILSTQHPQTGGYVYFTPARPRHYRVYSTANQGMWCCVGSGMENHGKYNQFIYAKRADSLFVNLYIPSEINWRDKKVRIRQETNFPFDEQVKLLITGGSSEFTLMIRYPSWVKERALKVVVNGKEYLHHAAPSSYLPIRREWKEGDDIRIVLPMHGRIERLPNVPDFVAILHGPILLAARTGAEDMKGLHADDGRWAHIASGKRLPVDEAPIFIEDDLAGIPNKLQPVERKPLTFAASNINMANPATVILEPFFQIHDSRYMMYWMALSKSKYQAYLDSLRQVERKKLAIENRTIDYVAPGEQQPEVDHAMDVSNSRTGASHDGFWRDAAEGGYFSYLLSTEGKLDLSLMVRYWGAEWGNRKFEIYIDDRKLVDEDNTGRWNRSQFFDVTYAIPNDMIRDKKSIRVKFQAPMQNTAGAVYHIRLLASTTAEKDIKE